jgi:methylated-DNA-protein-cysteine methyltransferase related protein
MQLRGYAIRFIDAMNRKIERIDTVVHLSVSARICRTWLRYRCREIDGALQKLSARRKAMSWDPVYRLIKKIPRGRVTTYGELARKLRLRGGARAVGYAMAACPGGKGIPWHRVVGAGGRLLIPEPHGSLQRRLLETEGVRVEFGRIDMRRYAWTPTTRRVASPKRKFSRHR